MGTVIAKTSGTAGIEKLRVYPATMSLDMEVLCRARNMDKERVKSDYLVDQRGVNPPWEDAVTMGVNAANEMLTDEDRQSIGLLIVGTETGVDQEKPVSSWIHRFLRLNAQCRNFEVKHACYAATGGVKMALAWLASPLAADRKALVISTDQSLIALNELHEVVTGAGAAAILLSNQPRLIEYETERCGVYATEISDVIRPTPAIETGNSDVSLFSYFEALEQTYENYVETVDEGIDFDTFFDWNIYHMPFAGIAHKAHRALMLLSQNYSKKETRKRYEKKTHPSTIYARQTGGTYGASTFVGLLGLAAIAPDIKQGQRVGIFAYGSGSCAEFYSAVILPEAASVAQEANLQGLLDNRYHLTIKEYESIEKVRDKSIMAAEFYPDRNICDGWYKRRYENQNLLVLESINGYYRNYGWS